MGFRCSWIAAQNIDSVEMLSRCHLVSTDRMTNGLDTGLFFIELAGGWRLILGDGWGNMERLTKQVAKKLPKALYFHFDQSFGSALLVQFSDGLRRWSIEHKASDLIAEPIITGNPPTIVEEHRARLSKMQATQGTIESGGKTYNIDHFFELAPAVGESLTGFRLENSAQLERLIVESDDA